MTTRNKNSLRVTGTAASAVAGSGFELLYAPGTGPEGTRATGWASLPLPSGVSHVALPTTPCGGKLPWMIRGKAIIRSACQ